MTYLTAFKRTECARQPSKSRSLGKSLVLRVLLIVAALGVVVWSLVFLFSGWEIAPVHALGPGLGNLRYNSNELFQPISIIQSPLGNMNVAMVNGYLMVIYASDDGGTSKTGGIEFWDVSDPRNPVLAVRHDNTDTHGLREPHGFGLSNSDSGQYMAAQAIDGIKFWDLSNPFDISLLSYMDLPGISQGDYTGDWWVFWQAPYVYVAGTGSGLYVVDATDPTQPVWLNQVTTSQMGGLNPGMAFAVGNLLVLMENQGGAYATMDISDPANPVLVQKVSGRSGYSHIFAAGKILTSGGNGAPNKMYVHNVTHDGVISFVGEAGSGLDNGGYGSYQDGFFHSGFSNKYAKFDIANLAQIGTGTSGLVDRDEDFGQVLGNLVYVGNDHGQGSALIVHQTAPDTTGPEVHWVHPQNGAPDVALSGRVGISMSDNVDIRSVGPSTFVVRSQGGLPLPGKYSVQMGLVNFTPDDPLAPNTTYEVVVSGIKDLVGNPGGTFTSQFSTTRLISNVTSAGGQVYVVNTFAPGRPVHTDAADTFTNQHPAQFLGQPYIRTAKSDADGAGSGFLTFDLSTDASIYVLYDGGASQFPAWLSDGTWTLTGDAVGISGPSATRAVFNKDFSAGTVKLGGNAPPSGSGATSMYSVLAISSAGTAAPRCTINPTSKARINTVVNFGIGTISGGDPITYSWNFGDGSPSTPPSTNPAVSHAYSAPGRYGVVLTAQNDFGAGSCAIVQIVHNPLTARPAVSSSPIVHNGVHSFNVNPDNNTVTAINEGSLTKAWEASVGSNPRTLAEAPNGDIWVVNQADATISVLRAGNGSLSNTLSLPYASRPYGIAFSPNGTAAYVTLQGTGRLLKLDTSGNIVGNIDVGPKPRGVAVSGDSSRILVTRFISPADHGEVRAVDAATFSLVRTVDLAFDPGPDTESSGRGLPNYVGFIRISPDGRRALVPSKKDNLARGLFRDGQPLTFESRVRTMVSQIDLANNVEDPGARIDLNDRDMAQSLIFSPAGDIFFVATQGSNRIEVYDANNLALLGGMNTGLAPQGMTFNRDASKLFVHNFMSRSVSVFDTTDYLNAVNNASIKLVEIATVSNEAFSPQVLLGKQIFHNASDPRMNRDGYISCASCHSDGGSDGQVWDFTQDGEGLRNTITLLGKSGTGQGNVHWTANFDEIQDFENDIRNGFGGTGFLSNPDFTITANPLGNPKAGLNAELDALAAYVSSLDTTPPSPHRNPDGTLTPDGEAGRQIFEAKNCKSCHSGPFFTDLLRHDVGTVQASSGLGIGQPLKGIGLDTPTLVGIWDTAPYLHNGQAATLQDVLSNPTHIDTAGLSPTEVDQLVSYLLQVDLPETRISSGPPIIISDSTASFSFSSSLTSSTFECQLDSGTFSGCISPKSYAGLVDGDHTFLVRAIDAIGSTDPTPASHTWTVDTAPPETNITDAPPSASNSAKASFSFTSSEAGSTFGCQLNGEGFGVCSPPLSYTDLVDGPQTFQVRSIDATGNTDPTPASYTWTVDAPPETTITNRPPKSSDSANASFSLVSNRAGSTFECQLNGGGFGSCSSPQAYTGLLDGSHTFQAKAIDANGETDPTPASFSWTVRTTRLDTSITNRPPSVSNAATASFSFSSSQAGSTFECQLDGGAFSPCSSPQPYTGLVVGPHAFQVRAIDPAGNADPTPASHTWSVDTTRPASLLITNILVSNGNIYRQDTLSVGQLTYIDRSYTFTSVPNQYLGQELIITANDDKTATNPDLLTFDLSADATVDVLFDNRVGTLPAWLNDGTWTLMDDIIDTSDVSRRIYRKDFDAGPVELGGNAMAPMKGASSNYSVVVIASSPGGTDAPETTITNGPSSVTNSPDATLTFTSSKANSNFGCDLDGSGFSPCTSPRSYLALGESSHTFQVQATDFSGVADSTPASHAWSVDATPPETTVTNGPPSVSNTIHANLEFSSSEGGSTFECVLDGNEISPCTSPWSYSALGVGSHTFQVRGTDPAGNLDATPARYIWAVDTSTPPGLLVTDIIVSNGQTYLQDSLNVGKQVYIDRSYTFTRVPNQYLGQELIITANNDKTATNPDLLTFNLSADATVDVLFDNRVDTLPAWLNDGTWTLMDDIIDTSDVSRGIYRKAFVAGPVELGGNAMAPMQGAYSNYNIVVIAK